MCFRWDLAGAATAFPRRSRRNLVAFAFSASARRLLLHEPQQDVPDGLQLQRLLRARPSKATRGRAVQPASSPSRATRKSATRSRAPWRSSDGRHHRRAPAGAAAAIALGSSPAPRRAPGRKPPRRRRRRRRRRASSPRLRRPSDARMSVGSAAAAARPRRAAGGGGGDDGHAQRAERGVRGGHGEGLVQTGQIREFQVVVVIIRAARGAGRRAAAPAPLRARSAAAPPPPATIAPRPTSGTEGAVRCGPREGRGKTVGVRWSSLGGAAATRQGMPWRFLQATPCVSNAFEVYASCPSCPIQMSNAKMGPNGQTALLRATVARCEDAACRENGRKGAPRRGAESRPARGAARRRARARGERRESRRRGACDAPLDAQTEAIAALAVPEPRSIRAFRTLRSLRRSTDGAHSARLSEARTRPTALLGAFCAERCADLYFFSTTQRRLRPAATNRTVESGRRE